MKNKKINCFTKRELSVIKILAKIEVENEKKLLLGRKIIDPLVKKNQDCNLLTYEESQNYIELLESIINKCEGGEENKI